MSNTLIHQDIPHYDMWLKLILGGTLAVIVVPALFSIDSDPGEAIGLFCTALFVAVIFWFVMPRRYLILSDRVRIVLGGPFSFNISFDTIKIARIPKGMTVGINFVTSFKNSVEIVRGKGMNVNISPGDRESFIEKLDKALDSWRDDGKGLNKAS